MESSITTINKIDLIQSAIQQLLDSSTHDADNRNLLTNLLSQVDFGKLAWSTIKELFSICLTESLLGRRLDSLKGDIQNPSKAPSESNEVPSSTIRESETKNKDESDTSTRKTGHEEDQEKEVVKELKKLGRQNKITHWLLSSLMILTVVWQISEVSILLKLKDGVRHPFRALGNVVSGVLNSPISDALKPEIPSSSSTKKNESSTPLNPDKGLSGLMTTGHE